LDEGQDGPAKPGLAAIGTGEKRLQKIGADIGHQGDPRLALKKSGKPQGQIAFQQLLDGPFKTFFP